MIQNLTKMNFREFGTILSERKGARGISDKPGTRQTLHLTGGSVPVYRSTAECWILGSGGVAVLSVSLDGVGFKHFHVDKSVCIRPGVWFCLTALEEGATVELSDPEQLQVVGRRKSGQDYLMSPGSRIDGV